MDLYEELNAYMSTYHPWIRLGNESLIDIQYSETRTEGHSVQKITIEEKENLEFKARKKVAKKQGVCYGKKSERQICSLDIPAKRLRESACPLCQWNFPESLTEEEMHDHVNTCIDHEQEEFGGKLRKCRRKRVRVRADESKEKQKQKEKEKEKEKERGKEKDRRRQNVKTNNIVDLEQSSEGEEIIKFEECPDCLLCLEGLPKGFTSKHKLLCKEEQKSNLKLMKKYLAW